LSSLIEANKDEVIVAIGGANIATSEVAMGESIKKATELADALDRTHWPLFETIRQMPADRAPEARDILEKVRNALTRDEHVMALAGSLQEAQNAAQALLDRIVEEIAPRPQPPKKTKPSSRSSPTVEPAGSRRGLRMSEAVTLFDAIQKQLASDPDLRMLSTEVGSTWFQASAAVLTTLPDTSQREWLDRTQKLLVDLKAAEYSTLSGFLMSGFNQRLAQFAACLQDFLSGRVAPDQLEACANDVRRHAQAKRQAGRMQRIDMALRLARYLRTGPHEERPASLSRVSLAYTEEGGYVDWARRYLSGGDETEELARAFGVLSARVRELRERQNREFARLLADWHESPATMESLLPIEQAMSAVVAKLVAGAPVLLLIIDGMNYAVFHELCNDLRDQGWIELTNQQGRPLPSLVSVVPSVTETSRASLLTGNVVRGNSASEMQSFATHADLLSVSRAGHPPLLFHKGELLEAGATGLSAVAREAIRDGDRKIVGVVLNAVDDHLARSDQLRFSWTISQFHHLDALLYEARLANRVVVVTSDHGHILEDGTSRLAGDKEERWRAFGAALTEQKVVFEGPRVEQAIGVRRIVVPWSETVRYGQKKQGYHGGATPQEVLVPVGIFTTPDRTIAGWEALPDRKPEWWSPAETPPAEAPDVPPRLTRHTKKPFLKALDQRHNRISHRALAQALGQPDVRMRGILVALQRLLNVDGYQIVAVDEDAGTIELNRQLLDRQFQV
jgi:PglZ domain